MAIKRKCPECGHSLIRSTHGANSIDYCKKCRYQINLNTGKVMYKNFHETDRTQIASCPNCDVQLEIPKMKGIMQLMCPFCSYNWQFDTGVPRADIPQWQTTCPKCNIGVQVDKNQGLRQITCLSCHEIWRFNSDTGEHLPDAKVYGDNILTTCPKCNRKNRVPNKQRNLLITCARCSHQFYLMGDPAFAKKDTASQFASATSSSMSSTTNTSDHSANTKVDNDRILTTCPECGRKHRVPRNHLNLLMTCGECSYRFYPMDNIVITKHNADTQSANTTARFTNSTAGTYGYSQNAKVYGDNILTSCPKCGRKSRVPSKQQNTLTTCGNCSHQFYPIDDTAFTKNNATSKAADTVPKSARSNAKSANTTTSSANTNTWSANTTQTTPPKESTNTSKENASQNGFFEGIKNFFKERKESAEAEKIFIEKSVFTHAIGEMLLNTLNDLRPELRGCSSRDYFDLAVYKSSFALTLFKDNLPPKYIFHFEFSEVYDLLPYQNGYTQIQSREARKHFREVVYHEHMVKCGFIKKDNYDRIYILKNQL